MDAGFQVFSHTCVTCHQPAGLGMPNAFPPLAHSQFLLADAQRSIDIVLHGLSGAIVVNDKPYAAAMPSFGFLTDDDIANVLTFVRNNWGNQGDPIAKADVTRHRAAGASTARRP